MAPAQDRAALRPRMTAAARFPTFEAKVIDHRGQSREISIPGETPLTIKIDGKEIVTLMTLGTHPEELALGYVRNQSLIEDLAEIASVEVDWDKQTASIGTTHGRGIADFEEKLSRITVGSGCGQGTIFSCTIEKIYELRVSPCKVRQSVIFRLMEKMAGFNTIYKQAGSVHGCGLCQQDRVLHFVEDVGRHNAADTIAGRMWLERIPGQDKILFSTGRLTSEIVMKAAQMRIPVLLSRSGVTQMGLELAQDLNITVIGRARPKRFLVYSGGDNLIFDALPSEPDDQK